MLALCVDDEALLLAALVRAVGASPDIDETVQFTRCSEAVAWAKDHKPDIAFLDVQLCGATGIELARKLQNIYPDLPVVFCTGYREYAFDAIQVHAAGYIMKPVNPEEVQKIIDYVKSNSSKEQPKKNGEKILTVKCFGNFEVFSNGKVLRFKRKRSKELLAYLIDRRGSAVSAKEICAALWEDGENESKNIMYFYKLLGDLKASLKMVDASDVIVKGSQDYAVDPEKLDCDFYRYIAGDPSAEKEYCGEYMTQYSWAENTEALLYGGDF